LEKFQAPLGLAKISSSSLYVGLGTKTFQNPSLQRARGRTSRYIRSGTFHLHIGLKTSKHSEVLLHRKPVGKRKRGASSHILSGTWKNSKLLLQKGLYEVWLRNSRRIHFGSCVSAGRGNSAEQELRAQAACFCCIILSIFIWIPL